MLIMFANVYWGFSLWYELLEDVDANVNNGRTIEVQAWEKNFAAHVLDSFT